MTGGRAGVSKCASRAYSYFQASEETCVQMFLYTCLEKNDFSRVCERERERARKRERHTHNCFLVGFGFLRVPDDDFQFHEFTGSSEQHLLQKTRGR